MPIKKNKKKEVIMFENPKKLLALVAIGICVVGLLFMSSSLVEVNNAGYYQVKQSISGSLSVKNEPGPYFQGMGTIITYPISDTLYFSKHDEEGGSTFEQQPVEVRFNDASIAKISGTLQFRLSQVEQDQLALHRDYKSFNNVRQNMIRPVVRAALMQAATLMRAEESYSSRRAEFATMAEEQIRLGIFETVSEELKANDVEGNDFIERTVKVKKDATGNPVVAKKSPFSLYNIEIVQFTIAEIDFDDTVDKLIAKKKEAEQQKVVARANAERAKQDAITAEEQGKAKIAEAKAVKEVEKIEAVTQAEKEYKVAELNKLRDKENAEAELIARRAEAEANRLLVQAGLTPKEKADMEMKTAIGVAEQLAKTTFPSIIVTGGGSNGGSNGVNPLDAMGLKAIYDLSKDMVKGSK